MSSKEKILVEKEIVLALGLLYQYLTAMTPDISSYDLQKYVRKINRNLQLLNSDYEIGQNNISSSKEKMNSLGITNADLSLNYTISDVKTLLTFLMYTIPEDIVNASLVGSFCSYYENANNAIGVDSSKLKVQETKEYVSGTMGIYTFAASDAKKLVYKDLELQGGQDISVTETGTFQKDDIGWYVRYSCQMPQYKIDMDNIEQIYRSSVEVIEYQDSGSDWQPDLSCRKIRKK